MFWRKWFLPKAEVGQMFQCIYSDPREVFSPKVGKVYICRDYWPRRDKIEIVVTNRDYLNDGTHWKTTTWALRYHFIRIEPRTKPQIKEVVVSNGEVLL